MVAVGEISC